jgi:hypothetical protein
MRSACIFILCLLIASLFSQRTIAQRDVADSIIRVIHTQQQDTNKIWSLIALADVYNPVKPDTALRLAVEAFELARTLDHKDAFRESLQQIGLAYHVVGDYCITQYVVPVNCQCAVALHKL